MGIIEVCHACLWCYKPTLPMGQVVAGSRKFLVIVSPPTVGAKLLPCQATGGDRWGSSLFAKDIDTGMSMPVPVCGRSSACRKEE